MREIKFRVWDKVHKQFQEGDIIRDFVIGEFIDDPQFEVTQYTGLTDRYGTEVYEGDILRGPKYYESEESTSPVYDQWKVTYKNCSFYLGYSPIEEDLDWIGNECEVVGNVYENPELLEN